MPEFDATIRYAPVPGFPNYQVGTDGSVWNNLIPGRKPETITGPWKRINPSPDPRGYLIVSLSRSGSPRSSKYLHSIILLSFVGPCPPKEQCRHLNDIKSDCRLENLCWGTPLQNHGDRKRNGRTNPGKKNGCAKLTENQVSEIIFLHGNGSSYSKLAKQFGVGTSAIGRIIRRESWIDTK